MAMDKIAEKLNEVVTNPGAELNGMPPASAMSCCEPNGEDRFTSTYKEETAR